MNKREITLQEVCILTKNQGFTNQEDEKPYEDHIIFVHSSSVILITGF